VREMASQSTTKFLPGPGGFRDPFFLLLTILEI
jgi:hypothetical protein